MNSLILIGVVLLLLIIGMFFQIIHTIVFIVGYEKGLKRVINNHSSEASKIKESFDNDFRRGREFLLRISKELKPKHKKWLHGSLRTTSTTHILYYLAHKRVHHG